MFSLAPVYPLTYPEGAFVLNLPHFSGNPQAATERIPSSIGGIYAWFRNFSYSENPEEFVGQLLADVEKPKFQSRTGQIKPFYEVTISSANSLSSGKVETLGAAANQPKFREILSAALSASILFQAPLYVGKSRNLRSRISQHLTVGSPLRSRLDQAGIEIDTCSVLVLPISYPPIQEDADEPEEAEEESLLSTDPDEVLFEEIFSRLFNPMFTLRIG